MGLETHTYEMILLGIVCFVTGFWVALAVSNAVDGDTAERGVWIHKKHAYKLTLIKPEVIEAAQRPRVVEKG